MSTDHAVARRGDVTKPFRDNAVTLALLGFRREVGKVPAAIARCEVARRGR